MKKVIVITACAVLFLFFGGTVSAETTNDGTYQQLYGESGAEGLRELLPESVRQFFDDTELNPYDPEWIDGLTAGNMVTHFLELLKNGFREPFRIGASVMAVLLIAAAFLSFAKEDSVGKTAGYAAVVSVAGLVLPAFFTVLQNAVEVIQSAATFMLGFVPVFAGIMTLSGAATTALSSGGLLLGAATVVDEIASYIVLPLMGGYLAVSVCSGVSPLLKKTRLSGGIKRIALWTLTLCSTLFAALLSVQTAIHVSADSVAVKTAKFFVGTTVPIAGPALSEAVTTVNASIGLVRSSVGVYGIVVIAAIVLPILLNLLLWRLVLSVCSVLCDFFSLETVSAVLESMNQMFSLLVGLVLLTAVLFIISLGVLVSAGRSL